MTSTFHLSSTNSARILTIARAVQAYALIADEAPAGILIHPEDRERVLTPTVEQLLQRRGMQLIIDSAVAPGTARLCSGTAAQR